MFAIPYFLLFLFCYYSFFVNTSGKKTEYSISLGYFCFLYLLIFLGFRGFVSTDWYAYYDVFDRIDTFRGLDYNYLKSFGWEIGTPFFMYSMKKMGVNYFGFCFVNSFIDLCVFYRFFRKYSKNIYLSWLFFIIFSGITMEFNLLRNTKAIDFFLISIEYIEKNKIKYFLINLLGLLFHITAIFFVLFFFIYYLFPIKQKRIILILWIIGLFIYIMHIRYISVFLFNIADYLPGRMKWLVRRYTTFNQNLISYGFGLGFIERFITFLLIYLNQERLLQQKKENKIFIVMIYLYLFIFLYLNEIFELTARLTTLTVISYWILFPALYDILNKKKKLFFIAIFTVYSFIKIYAIFGNDLSLQYENIIFGAQSYNERVQNNLKYRLEEKK